MLNIYLYCLQVIQESEIIENVDEVEGEPGAHEDNDYADEECECPLASRVAGLGLGASARSRPEGEAGEPLVDTARGSNRTARILLVKFLSQ